MAENCDEVLARLIQEYHRRLARGDEPEAEDFREEAGECFEELTELIRQEQLFDEALATERFPRAFGRNREYTLVARLGAGGIGIVYKAIQRHVSRAVALKVLKGDWANDKDLLKRFLEGARKAAQVEHPHVVRIYDAGVFEGRPYIAMNLVEGTDLHAVYCRLREEAGPPPFGPEHHRILTELRVPEVGGDDSEAFVRRLATLLLGPAEALKRYHDEGIVHRDVKPANLMLDLEGRLILTDFDLAKKLESSVSQTASKVGTPGYMSPEQMDPMIRDVDGRADIYSLSIVFYEGLAQQTPFKTGGDLSSVFQRTLTENAPNLQSVVEEVPLSASRVIMKAIERERKDRYQSMDSLIEGLRAVAEGEHVDAPLEPVRVRRARRKLWKNRWFVAALLLITAAVAFFTLRPANVSFVPSPRECEVLLDGESLGLAPITERSIESGSYRVTIRHELFEAYDATIEFGPGDSRTLNPVLKPKPGREADAARVFAKELGVSLEATNVPRARSNPPSDGPVLLFPRGRVRKADLGKILVEAAYVGDRVEIGKPGEEPILSLQVNVVEQTYARAPIPKEAIARLEPGTDYECRVSRNGKIASREVISVASGPSEEEVIERASGRGDTVGALLVIAQLQSAGLHDAALARCIELAQIWKPATAYMLAWTSIEALGLKDTGYAASVADAHAATAEDD